MSKDNLYKEHLNEVKAFAFDTQVAAVFDDMIRRSVPLYREVQETTIRLAARFAIPGTAIYDLGCASGETLLGLGTALDITKFKPYGVDSSAPMLDKCRERLTVNGLLDKFTLEHCEIEDIVLAPSSVVILNYTLQFLPVESRLGILSKVQNALLPEGILILAEKITHTDAALTNEMNELHREFKLSQGYSALEVDQKRAAIENVLVPLSLAENLKLLTAAGFKNPEVALKSYTFAAFFVKK